MHLSHYFSWFWKHFRVSDIFVLNFFHSVEASTNFSLSCKHTLPSSKSTHYPSAIVGFWEFGPPWYVLIFHTMCKCYVFILCLLCEPSQRQLSVTFGWTKKVSLILQVWVQFDIFQIVTTVGMQYQAPLWICVQVGNNTQRQKNTALIQSFHLSIPPGFHHCCLFCFCDYCGQRCLILQLLFTKICNIILCFYCGNWGKLQAKR